MLVTRAGHTIDAACAGSPAATSPPDGTVFDIGSIGKSFTAAAVLRLEADGKLELDDRVTRFLPGVPAADRKLTIAALLTHTSGLPAYFSADTASFTRLQAERAILALPLGHPGRFVYSDAGYTLLAAIVERASGMPFRSYVERRLLRPAGMTHTGWYGPRIPLDTSRAHGLVAGSDRGQAGLQASPTWSTLGAGGMVSTAADLARWATALSDDRVLPASETKALFTPRLRLPNGAGVAYGWVTGKTAAGTAFAAVGGGTDYGFTSDLRIFPSKGLVTVALSDTSAAPAIDLAAALGRDLPELH